MENEIEMKIRCKDPIIKRVTTSGNDRSSVLRLPKTYLNKDLCIIPINYKFKLPKPNNNQVYEFTIKSNMILNKVLHSYRSNNYCNLPFSLLGIDVLVFEKPKNNY